jgi:hypothetical protein
LKQLLVTHLDAHLGLFLHGNSSRLCLREWCDVCIVRHSGVCRVYESREGVPPWLRCSRRLSLSLWRVRMWVRHAGMRVRCPWNPSRGASEYSAVMPCTRISINIPCAYLGGLCRCSLSTISAGITRLQSKAGLIRIHYTSSSLMCERTFFRHDDSYVKWILSQSNIWQILTMASKLRNIPLVHAALLYWLLLVNSLQRLGLEPICWELVG